MHEDKGEEKTALWLKIGAQFFFFKTFFHKDFVCHDMAWTKCNINRTACKLHFGNEVLTHQSAS